MSLNLLIKEANKNWLNIVCQDVDCKNCIMETQQCLGVITCDSLLVGDITGSTASITCNNLDVKEGVKFEGISEAYSDRLLFYNTTTKDVSYNKGYFSQEINTTFISEYYSFELPATVRLNIVGNQICVFIKFFPYTYFESVSGSGVWSTNNNPLVVPPVDGAIFTSYMVNNGNYTPILIRCFDNGNIQLQDFTNNWPTTDTLQLNVYNVGFQYINPDS